jgi:hypothetical protein
MPSTVRIPSQHVEKSGAITSAGDGPTAPTAFVPDEHYFQVRVNEMFLVNQREWFKDYDPIAFVTTEFLYQDQSEALPFVVGPSMMQNFQSTTPTGMIFANTGVAGPHPYRGGALKLTMILGRIERTDYARRFLGWIDNATKIFDFATALGAYLKVGNLILDGIEALTGNGGNNLLAGLRNEINPDAGDTFIPGYYALIDQPGVKPEELWVRDNQLYCGGAEADLKPFRNADYLLYSIMQTAERTDLIKLPYYSDYERVIGLAAQSTTEDQWKATKANMSALFLKLRLSLT